MTRSQVNLMRYYWIDVQLAFIELFVNIWIISINTRTPIFNFSRFNALALHPTPAKCITPIKNSDFLQHSNFYPLNSVNFTLAKPALQSKREKHLENLFPKSITNIFNWKKKLQNFISHPMVRNFPTFFVFYEYSYIYITIRWKY